jgi:hypothetical protein
VFSWDGGQGESTGVYLKHSANHRHRPSSRRSFRWMPVSSVLASLVFGFAEAMSMRVQAFKLPVSSYVIQMAPYIAALLVLAVLGRGARVPAAIGQPFRQS